MDQAPAAALAKEALLKAGAIGGETFETNRKLLAEILQDSTAGPDEWTLVKTTDGQHVLAKIAARTLYLATVAAAEEQDRMEVRIDVVDLDEDHVTPSFTWVVWDATEGESHMSHRWRFESDAMEHAFEFEARGRMLKGRTGNDPTLEFGRRLWDAVTRPT